MDNSSKTSTKIIAVIVAVIVAVAAFFAGFFTRKLTEPQYVASYEWAIKTIRKNYFYEFDEKKATNLSLKEIVANMLDRYSAYYTVEEYKALINDNSGEKSGLGITFSFIPNEGARIVSVMGNSPAYLKGLRVGDTVTGAKYSENGEEKEVEFAKSSEFSSFIDARATGEKMTFVTKTVGGKEAEREVFKEFYSASYAFYATKNSAWEVRYSEGSKEPVTHQNPEDKIGFLPDNFGYIRLNQFYGKAGDEFGRLMEKFNADGCTSLILDLRNNGGGYVSVMQDIAGYFTSSLSDKTYVAMTAEYKNGRKEVYNCYKHGGAGLVKEGTEVYVLANSGTASASEALIGVLASFGFLKPQNIFLSDFSKEYLDFAGSGAKTKQSYGKGIMQTTFTRRTGEALKLTTAQIYWPNGKCIHDVGLTEAYGCRLAKADWTATAGDRELEGICNDYLR